MAFKSQFSKIVETNHEGQYLNMGRSRKDPHFCRPEGGGEKKLFLIIVNVLGLNRTSNGGRGVNFPNFLCGDCMDVYWNDPILSNAYDPNLTMTQTCLMPKPLPKLLSGAACTPLEIFHLSFKKMKIRP